MAEFLRHDSEPDSLNPAAGESSADPTSAEPEDRGQLIDQLQQAVSKLERSHQSPRRDTVSSSGCQPLDALLPEQGFAPGSLIEWLSVAGGGAAMLAMIAAREAMREGGALVVMDRRGEFYPPAAAALGVDLDNLVVIRAAEENDELWALDQALRCPGVAAAWAELQTLDWRWFRRLQLAAEEGGGLGLLQRPPQVRGQPTWAAVQLLVQPAKPRGASAKRKTSTRARSEQENELAAWRLRVEVLRCRGGRAGGVVKIEMNDISGKLDGASQEAPPPDASSDRVANDEHETHSLHMASQLARSAARRRSARA